MHLRSFKSRLAVVVLGLIALVQTASFAAVALSARASARERIDEDLWLASALLAIGASGLLLAVVAGAVLARRVSRPVLALTHAAGCVAAGDLSARAEVHGRDELGTLAGAFNDMVARLRERDRARREHEHAGRLSRCFSPKLAELLSAGDDGILAPHRATITVASCDLRGFTHFAETAEPHEAVRLLAAYHEIVRPLVFDYGGAIERFTGDALIVIFNDPIPCPDPAVHAVRMALAVRDAVDPLLEAWRRRGHALGLGVGIATADATLGRIASDGRLDYAVIGEVTGVSARLSHAARDGQVLVTQRVHAEIEHVVHAVAMGPFTMPASGKPLSVFNVVALRGADSDAMRAG